MSFQEILPKVMKIINKAALKQGVSFCLSGTTSLFLQGINVKPNDLDLCVANDAAFKLVKALKKYCVQQVEFGELETLSSWRGVLKINGIEVDVLGDFKVKVDDKWFPVGARRLEEKNFVEYNGIQVMCSSFRLHLLSYKAMGRDKDKEKIKLIESKLNENKPIVSDGLVKVAKKVLFDFLQARKNSKILLINDHEPNSVLEAFKSVLDSEKIPFAEAKLKPERANSEPIPEIASQMNKAKIIIAPTKKSITHAPETIIASEKGAKIITLSGVTEEVFLKIGEADFDWIWKENNKIAKQLKGRSKVEIKTPNGTNISFSIKKQSLHGLKPRAGGFVMNLPMGEVYCAPIEETAEGEIFIDYFKDLIKPEDKAWLKVEMGKISEWNNAAQAFIESQRSENGLVIAEFGVGTNKWHTKPIGNILHDEKIFGSVHIAFGNNISFGGRNKSTVHNDLILMNPKALVDGKKLEW